MKQCEGTEHFYKNKCRKKACGCVVHSLPLWGRPISERYACLERCGAHDIPGLEKTLTALKSRLELLEELRKTVQGYKHEPVLGRWNRVEKALAALREGK